MSKGQKWYVVWEGRNPGIYLTWAECRREVDGFPRAKYKSFTKPEAATIAFQRGWRTGNLSTSEITKQVAKNPPTSAKSKTPGKKRAGAKTTDAKRSTVDVDIYCDGACEPNPGPSGSGIALYRQGELDSLYLGLYAAKGTNNTAELNALHQALMLAKEAIAAGESVRIWADSMYAIKCISVWAHGWKKRNWKRPNGDPVKNPDIIAPAHELYVEIKKKLSLRHVKGHAGIEGNELADRMAMRATMEKQPNFVRYYGKLDVSEILKFKKG